MEPLAIDVVLRTHNRAALLEAAVESLFAADQNGIALRLFVVDNASTDDTAGKVAELHTRHGERLVPLYEPRRGAQHPLNQALRHCDAPIVAFFDDDERVERGWLQSIRREFADPATEFMTGPVLPLWDREPPAWVPEGWGGVLGIIDYGPDRLRFYRDFGGMLTQGNCALRRSIFEESGPYPDALTTAEDRWLNGFLEAGRRVGYYCPDFAMRHVMQVQRLSPAYFREWAWREGRNRAIHDQMASLTPLWRQPWYWKDTWQAVRGSTGPGARKPEALEAGLRWRFAVANLLQSVRQSLGRR